MCCAKRLALLSCALAFWGCGERSENTILQAGFAQARLPAPVGIGTSGFGGLGVAHSPTPFAQFYPGTTGVHGHPQIKALAVRQGQAELVVVRVDLIAVTESLRQDVVVAVQQRVGRDLYQGLILAATHTHAGPGRFIPGVSFSLIADTFWPPWYERLVHSLADAAVAAMDDLQPATILAGQGEAPSGHADRRCVDLEDYTNSRVPLLLIQRQGRPAALLASYAVHSTLVGMGELFLSGDVHGAIEEQLENLFSDDVHVMLLQSWSGDVRAANPTNTLPTSPRRPSFDRIERVAVAVAAEIGAALPSLKPLHQTPVKARTVRFAQSRELLGYDSADFPYDNGAVYCSSLEDSSCEEIKYLEDMASRCLPFSAHDSALRSSLITIASIGELTFVTWPGEAGTRLAESALDGLASRGAHHVFFVGYANDYLGYQLLESDWWRGGYEAAGAVWGPKHGEFLRQRLWQIFEHSAAKVPLPFASLPPITAAAPQGEPYQPMAALAVGSIVEHPVVQNSPLPVAQMALYGDDPWHGAPLVVLQHQHEEGDFKDMLRQNGLPITSDGFGFWLTLQPEPSYTNPAEARRFLWRLHWLVNRYNDDIGAEALSGPLRFKVHVPTQHGPMTIYSDAFEVNSTDT